VKQDTRSVVVLLTQQTFLRMWCAGEISTAVFHEVPVVPVPTEDFTAPDESFFSSLDSVWSVSAMASLEASGITLDKIEKAYRKVMTVPQFPLPQGGSVQQQEVVVAALISQAKIRTGRLATTPPLLSGSSSLMPGKRAVDRVRPVAMGGEEVVVLGMRAERTQITIQRILQDMLSRKLGFEILIAYEENHVSLVAFARVLVILLSSEILTTRTFGVLVAVAANYRHPDLVTVTTSSDFPFPAPEFFEQVASGALLCESQSSPQLQDIPIPPPAAKRRPPASPRLRGRSRGNEGLDASPEDLSPECARRSTGQVICTDVSQDQLASAYRAVFRILALPFSALASKVKMELEVAEIAQRLVSGLQKQESTPNVLVESEY